MYMSEKKFKTWRQESEKKNFDLEAVEKCKISDVEQLLKLKTIHNFWILCLYKRQISMLRLIALRGVRAHKNMAHLQHR